ncbi:MAG: ABC transporter permease [Syntrophomonadaceae bacterium]|jgi:putative ABC transport system permease protein|nr:ABC transporter permease [Syntrophomonadaceae bacterium]
MSILAIARNNLLHRRFHSLCLAVLIALTAFVIAGGTLFGSSLRNGVRSTSDRLGADAMFLPPGAEKELEGALLEGKPSTFYLPGDTVRQLSEAKNVKRASPQLYVATFDSSHCASLVQIISYDPKTDFVVAPWLADSVPDGPKTGEIIIGNSIQLEKGEEMLLFDMRYKVAGKLEKTGMGFDVSVFAGMETAHKLIERYEKYIGAIPMPDKDAASVIVVEIEKGIDHESFARDIRIEYRSVSVILPQAIIGNMVKHLDLTIAVLTGLLVVIWLLSAFMLAIVFTVAMHERKREFGVFRAFGATRGKLVSILMTESALLSIAGSGAGILLLCITVLPFNAFIESLVGSEYLLPSAAVTTLILGGCFLLCASVGPIAAVVSAMRIGRAETSLIIREDI